MESAFKQRRMCKSVYQLLSYCTHDESSIYYVLPSTYELPKIKTRLKSLPVHTLKATARVFINDSVIRWWQLAGKAVSKSFNGLASKNESQPMISVLKVIQVKCERDPVISMNKNYLSMYYIQTSSWWQSKRR